MSRRRWILLAVGALVLAAAGLVLYMLQSEQAINYGIELPAVSHESGPTRTQEIEPSQSRTAITPPTPAEPEPPEDLRAEGTRRGWQLPVGKGWWLDTLINPGAVELDERRIEALQERVLRWGDQLIAWKLQRRERLDAYCQERIAAGLADPDPKPGALPAAGHEHVLVTTHTPQAPNQLWRIDVGPGDDAELDNFERQIARTWSSAVLDLRRNFAAARR